MGRRNRQTHRIQRQPDTGRQIGIAAADPAQPAGWKALLQPLTVIIALWGAVLSSWVFVQQRVDRAPRIYVRMDVQATGRLEKRLVGDILVSVSNVGNTSLSIGPYLTVVITDSSSGQMYRTQAIFRSGTETGQSRQLAPGPVTLQPGQDGQAATAMLSDQVVFDPLDHHSVLFELSDGGKYLAFFPSEKDYLKRESGSGAVVGWSAGRLAEKL